MAGYEAKFDPPLDKRLECPICLLAQREPMQTPCGHRFCSTCILRALRETGARCPVDNTKISNHQLFKDNFAKREVLSLNVKCPAEDNGCQWHGELRNLEVHVSVCELVFTECPNCCGHSCQRKDLSPHLSCCVNKPQQCPNCSIHFAINRLDEHKPHCSKMVIPESMQNTLLKANEVLKWSGTIKLKITNPCSAMFQQPPNSTFPITGYLTAKADTPESFLFTGNWSCSLSVMPLNSPAAKIFWKKLHGPEVQAKSFGFGVFGDSKSNTFCKVLKKKLTEMSAVVGLHLKSGNSRTDLTIIYFYWNEHKKRLMACVAELKSHLVKQIQNHLHVLQQNSSRRERTAGANAHTSRSQSHSRSSQRALHQTQHHFPGAAGPSSSSSAPVPPPPPPPGHIQHHHMHPGLHPHQHHQHHQHHPTAAVALVTPGLANHQQSHHPHLQQQSQQQPVQQQTQQSHLLSSHLQQQHESQASIVHPRILSWQMSQSFNGYPWRMQAGNVPFFTFPSTPPSFLPANPYPYTFAPAPPFSINQIAQVPTTAVPVPSYAGIAVPQATGVDSMVTGPTGTTFPIAAIPSLTDHPGEHLHSVPPGAVAVTIASANPVPGQPPAATVVIQQPVLQQPQEQGPVQGQDMAAVIHAIGAPPPHHPHYPAPAPISAHLAPAIITAEGTQGPGVMQPTAAHLAPAIITAEGTQGPGVMQPSGPSVGGEGVAVGRYHGPIVAALPPHMVSVGAQQHNMVGVSVDYAVPTTDAVRGDQHRAVNHPATSMMQEDAGPSMTAGHFSSREDSDDHQGSGPSHSGARHLNNDGAGPSRAMDSDASSDNDSLDSGSPSRNFAAMFYRGRPFPHFDHDSDDSDNMESGDSMLFRRQSDLSDLSPESNMSSDESASPSESDSDSPTNPSTLRLISGNTGAVVASPASEILPSPGEEVSPAETSTSTFESEENNRSSAAELEGATSSEESDPLSLPVLINISDSDSLTSHTTTHASVIDLTAASSLGESPSASSSNTSSSTAHSQSYSMTTNPPPVFLPVINQLSAEGDMEVSRIISRREGARYLGASIPSQHALRLADSASTNSAGSQEMHLSMMQMAQPPQLYAAAAAAQGHVIIQQQAPPPPPPPPAPQSYPPHEHATHSVFPSYPQQLPHPSGPGGSAGSLEMTTLPVPAAPAAVVPLETGAVAAAMGHGANIHVLRWQQALSQQHQAGDMASNAHPNPPMASTHSAATAGVHPVPPSSHPIPPTAHPTPGPTHPPSAPPVAGPTTLPPHPTLPMPTHAPVPFPSRQGVEQPEQQLPAGNFWETVMPSLDMSLQGNTVTSTESSL